MRDWRSISLMGVACAWLALAPAAALAQPKNVQPPKPVLQTLARWPGADPPSHPVVVPVVITVERDGTVEEVRVEVSLSDELDAAAIAAARKWRFEPARDDEGAVRAKIRAVVRFEVAESKPDEPVEDDAEQAPPPEPAPSPQQEPTQPSTATSGDDEPRPSVTDVVVQGEAPARSGSQVVRRREVLQAAPHRTASDLLRTVPGVFVTQHSGEGKAHQILFRGFDAIHGQDLEVFVAGVPVNEVSNVHGQGYADLHFVMPEVVQRIEAFPGTFDPSQGDFAIAGSMRFMLGYPEPGITATGSYGSFNARRAFLAYHPPDQPEETFAAFETYATDGFGVARAAQRTSAIGQLRYPLSDELSARVMASAYAGRFGSAGVVRRSDVDAGIIDRFGSYDSDQGGHSTRSQLVTELAYATDDWDASLAPFVVRRTLRLRYNFTGRLEDPQLGDNALQRNDFTSLGMTARLRKQLPLLSPHDSVGAGIFARHDMIEQRHLPSHGAGPVRVDADVTATNVGGYLDLALRPLPRTVVRGGVRIDGLSFSVDDQLAAASRSAQGMHIGPKATVDVAITPKLHALASYGQGFRSPQARSLGDGEETPFTRAYGFEAGARYQDGRKLVAALAGFGTLLDDDLVFNEATSRNEQVPGTLRLGVAANLELNPNDWFTSAFGVNYARATFRESSERFAEGDLRPFVPQLVARSDLAFRPVLTKIGSRALRAKLGAGFSYLFNRPLPYGEMGSDVFLIDMLAGLRLQEVELSLSVTNLLDASWYDGEFVYASDFGGGASSQIPQRHVTAGAPASVMGSLSLYL